MHIHAHAHVHVNVHVHLQFEDLLSEAEADAMIDRCRNFGKFERSQVLQPPLMLPPPSYTPLRCCTPLAALHPLSCYTPLRCSQAGDQISTVRTSTQCWCDDNDDCLANPAVRALTDRMMNVTRLPYNNAEYFQILQYHEGQFYKTHHDQQTAFWTPQACAPHAHPMRTPCAPRAHRLCTVCAPSVHRLQGVRVYTFFVYLSDVEQGGGTRFTDLGITVTPKRGRGILWPSVLTNNLNEGDMRTHHEALPVEKGVKHAANLWQHLYDFKSPSRSGLCPFLGQNTNP